MTGDSTLPGCFTLKRPMPPNRCETCRYREDCGRYVRRDTLTDVLRAVKEAKAIAKGEKLV
jgi:hypothetical protein